MMLLMLRGAARFRAQMEQAETSVEKLRERLMGVSRTALHMGRTFFWTALSVMFIYMGMSRAETAVRRIRMAKERLARATRTLEREQRRATEVVLRYGYGSEEASEALERLRERQLRVRELTYAVSDAHQVAYMAVMMYVWGFVALITRIVEVIIITWEYVGAQIANIIATKLQTTANRALLASFLALAGVVGLVLIAIQALVSWYAAMSLASMKASEDAKLAREEIEELGRTIRGLPLRRRSPLEIKTQYGWVEFPERFRIPLAMGRVSVYAPTIFNITATIRRDEDIDALVRKISEVERFRIARGG